MRQAMLAIVAVSALAVTLPEAATAQNSGRGQARRMPDRVTEEQVEELYRRRIEEQMRRQNDDRYGRRDDDRYGRRDDDRYGRRDDGRYDRRDDDRYDPRRRDDDWWENRRDRDDWWLRQRRGNGNGPSFCRSGAGHPVYGRQWCVNKGFGLGRDVRWDRVRWDDVIFRRWNLSNNYTLSRAGLIDVLGNVVFGRLDARRRYLGINAPLTGRWHNDGGRSILLVQAGSVPLAELIDGNRDRRVELVLVNLGR